jgi:hypothetical protein
MARSANFTIGVALTAFALTAAAATAALGNASESPYPSSPAGPTSTPSNVIDGGTDPDVQQFTDKSDPPLPPCVVPTGGGEFICVFEGTAAPR